MTIKDDFWKLIKSDDKTIELRHINKLNSLGSADLYERIWVDVENINGKKIGYITINGYSIISKKEFIMYKNLTISNGNKGKNLIPNWFTKNWNWIYENWLWLINDYFKNETEILVLKIESWGK